MRNPFLFIWAKAAEAYFKVSGKKPIESENLKIMLVTAQQLKDTTTNLTLQRCQVLASLFNKMCPGYGITTKDQFHEFAANVLQESGECEHREENMNYSAQRLAAVWPNRFSATKTKPYVPNQLAISLHRKPKEIAIAAYGGRMGNRPGTEDGWNLRGGGWLGLTGIGSYQPYQKYKGFKTIEEAANYARDSDEGALDSALWFFCIHKDLEDEAERDEMMGIIKSINGGYIGKKDRLFYYERAKKVIV